MLKKILLKSMVVGSLLSVSLLNANQLEDIKKSGVLKVAVPQDFAPFGSVSKDMSIEGYDVDTAKLIADKLGVKLELIPVTSANRIPYLQTGKANLTISSLGKNPQRAKAIDFSDAYGIFYLGVFGSKDVNVTAVSDLKGKTVGVTRGTIEDMELSDKVDSSVTIRRFEDNNMTTSSFLSGQVNLIATGNVIVSELARKNPGKEEAVTKFMLKNNPCYIGVKKGEPELLAYVNSFIKEYKVNGKLNESSKKWFRMDLPKDL